VDDTPNRLSGRREKEIRSDSRCWGNAEQHDQDWGQQRSAANASRANEGTNEETDDRVVRIDRSKQHDRLLANPPPFDRQSRDLMADHRYEIDVFPLLSSPLRHSATLPQTPGLAMAPRLPIQRISASVFLFLNLVASLLKRWGNRARRTAACLICSTWRPSG